MTYLNKLTKTFKEYSSDGDNINYFKEWSLKGFEEVNKCGVCSCGKTNLRYIYKFINIVNGNILDVGSVCVKKLNILTNRTIECFDTTTQMIKEREYIKKTKKSLKNGDCFMFKTKGIYKTKIENYLYTIKMKYNNINVKKVQCIKKIIKNPPIWSSGDYIYCNIVYKGEIDDYLMENKNKINCMFKINNKGYTNIIIK